METQEVSLYRGWTLPQSGPTLVNTKPNTTVRCHATTVTFTSITEAGVPLKHTVWLSPPCRTAPFPLQAESSFLELDFLALITHVLCLSSLSFPFYPSLTASVLLPLSCPFISLFPFSVYPHYFYR